jgi:hypothetical protein
MGLEPMTSPLPRECSTTELHQPSCFLRSSILCSSPRARTFAITTRNANKPRNRIGIHRTSTSRSAIPTYLVEYPCMCITAVESIVNHDSKPKTTKTPSAITILRLSAAGLSDRSLSPIAIAPGLNYVLSATYSLLLKNGAQGRIRTFVTRRVADLQSAAINHSATCALMLYQRTLPQPIAPVRSLARIRAKSLPELSMANTARLEQLAGTTNFYIPTHLHRPATAPNLLRPRKSGAGEGI